MVIKNGTCPMSPEAGKTAAVPVTPVISVRSVNGEIGDVVLRKLVVGAKEYNGYERIEIEAKDLGLEQALKYVKSTETIQQVKFEIAQASLGDLFYCKEDTLFYFVVAPGEYKTFGSGEHFDTFAKAAESASKVVTHISDDFELTLDLLDRDGNKFFTSEPVVIPFKFDDIIKDGYYDESTKELVFVLKSEKEIRIPVSGMISGLQKEITDENKLAFRLVEGLNDFKVDIYDKLNAEIDARADADSAEVVARNNAIGVEKVERIAAVTSEKDARTAADNTERNERIAADTAIRTDLSTVTTQLSAEVAARKSGDETNDAHLQLEVQQRQAKDNELKALIDSEVATRTSETAELRNSIVTEISDRTSAVATLTQDLATERANRINNDSKIRSDLTAETNTRTNEVATLTQNLADEVVARKAADNTLTVLFNDEVVDRKAADDAEKLERQSECQAIRDSLAIERSNRITNDETLQTNINNEAATRLEKDNELNNKITEEVNARAGADTVLQSNIDTEASTRATADTNLQAQIDATPVYSMVKDSNPGDYSAVYHLTKQIPGQEAVNVGEPINIAKDLFVKTATVRKVESDTDPAHTEGNIPVGHTCIDLTIRAMDEPTQIKHVYIDVTTLIDVYTAGYGITIENYNIRLSDEFTHRVTTIEENLETERNNRIYNDEVITGKLTTETTERKAADDEITSTFNTKISTETNERKSADAGITNFFNNKIEEEASTRATNDTEIDTRLTNAISKEINDRTTADSTLQSSFSAALSTESSLRSQTDISLQEQINTTKNTLTQEIIDRTTSDAALQAAIDAILAKRDSCSNLIVGDGVTTSFQINHGLGTKNVIVQIYKNLTGATILTDVVRTNENIVTVTFNEAPVSGIVYTVLCYGIVSNASTVEISFMPNGGTGVMSKKNAVVGSAFTMPTCTFTAPAGMEFDCWSIGSTTGTHVKAGETYIFTEATSAYAIWKTTKFTFYYGSVSKEPIEAKSIAALEQMQGANKTATELKTEFTTMISNGVPSFAVSDGLGVSLDYLWSGNSTFRCSTIYTYNVDNYTFYCWGKEDDEQEGVIVPQVILEETEHGIKFK